LSAEPAAAHRPRRALADWRVWLGVGITLGALAWTVRGVPFGEIAAALENVDYVYLLLAVPFPLLGLWFRALRWRWLALPLAPQPLPLGALYRATAVGFMAINVFPLRLGELVRPWLLARETGVRGSAALGTLVLERAIDFTSMMAIGGVVLWLHARAMPEWVRVGAAAIAVVALTPFVLIAALRRAERQTLALISLVLRPLPAGLRARLEGLVEQVCVGLVALRGARAVAMVALYSVLLWAGLFFAPFALGIAALRIELPLGEALFAGYTVLVFTALAIAAPAAPGFFGTYHFACREALALFDVPAAQAVAYGTLVHLAYLVPSTLAGLFPALRAGIRLGDLWSAAKP
jgi:hypothetical protein